jgi:prepilin-type N-terminal cleavage/methylation domain-containing protein
MAGHRRPSPALRARGGFTLVELIIVVAVIAALAGLAIPHLLQSKLVANETSAIAALRAYAGAQAVFLNTDHDRDGILEYADEFRDLYYTEVDGEPIAFIDKAFADAADTSSPRGGYFFEDLSEHEVYGPFDYASQFALSALPARYGGSGVNTLVIDRAGIVYQKDRESNASLEGVYPDVETSDSGWVPAGER